MHFTPNLTLDIDEPLSYQEVLYRYVQRSCRIVTNIVKSCNLSSKSSQCQNDHIVLFQLDLMRKEAEESIA